MWLRLMRVHFLGRIKSPVLVLSGGRDVIATQDDIEDLTSSLPVELVAHQHFAGSAHEIFHDVEADAVNAIRGYHRVIFSYYQNETLHSCLWISLYLTSSPIKCL